MNAQQLICDLARTFEQLDDAGADLWTWLPSHLIAIKAKSPLTADSLRPSNSEIMREAASLFALLRWRGDSEMFDSNLGELRDSVYEMLQDGDDLEKFATKEAVLTALVELKYLPEPTP